MTDAKLSDFSGDQDFDPDQPDAAKPFEAVGVDQLPHGLPRAALDAVAEFGARTGLRDHGTRRVALGQCVELREVGSMSAHSSYGGSRPAGGRTRTQARDHAGPERTAG